MTTEKRVGTILFLLVMLVVMVFVVFTAGSELIAAFKMEDRVESSWVMFMLVFSSPFILYFLLFGIYLGIILTPEKLKKLEKTRTKKKKKKSTTLHERIMGFFLAIELIGLIMSIPLSWYMHFKLLGAGYIVCERTSPKAPTRYAKEEKLCH
ncbi:putative Similar to membrane protein [Xenorhabdus poinarii G6]|uniref:Putative Similar to membrane protein n=1 Tax=Xenorhabdus poinarii G6 TaxID=1354304 RepID=A0A068R1I0_9GAMM|nr:DUF1240 domain-containing protein [Xenorhabdus poinarii]CDG21147.1 putative Similar to membrane protein [Xenorhabdus poinarii G6]